MKENEFVLLLSKERSYLVRVCDRRFNTDFGIVDLLSLRRKRFGSKIKTHKGFEFLIVKPSIVDFLSKRIRKLPQAIRPKDSALILAYTGLSPDAKVVEAGTGSAWLTIFLANYCCKGKIFSYEVRKDFYENAQKNIQIAGVKNVVLKNKDILKGIDEKDIDLVVLDMKRAERAVSLAYDALKPGGWLVVFSPYIEQVKEVVKEMKQRFCSLVTIENVVREWDVRSHTLPKRYGLLHSGWLTFGRKI